MVPDRVAPVATAVTVWLYPETHTKRQATQHDCLPRKKYFVVVRPDKPSRTKISCSGTISPMNQPQGRTPPFHVYSLSPHSPQFHTLLSKVSLAVSKAAGVTRAEILQSPGLLLCKAVLPFPSLVVVVVWAALAGSGSGTRAMS